ncbi:MAG: hypothetical protein GEU79_08710, partial [Acidimicrobiia bacterium]|nr:hypothetical protein [Acidimicrobiia bacterium]
MTSYGFWDSPLSATEVVAAATTIDMLSAVRAGSGRVIWAESRPQEGGRITLIEPNADGEEREVLPEGYSARSAVHEYGGAAFSIIDGSIYFVNWEDQRIYRLDGSVTAVTEEPPSPRSWRYSVITGSVDQLFAIRERHEADTVLNEIVAICDGEMSVVAGGSDFYDAATPSPSGERLAWIEWDHPNMPWDETRLVVANKDGSDAVVVASGAAVQQPSWVDDDTLVYLDDRSGYWNLYRHELSSGTDTPLYEIDHDMGYAPFLLGTSTYAVVDENRIAAVVIRDGMDELGVIEDGQFQACAPGLSFVRGLVADGGIVYFVGASFTQGMAIYRLEEDNELQLVSTPKPVPLDEDYIAVGEHHSFDSGDR